MNLVIKIIYGRNLIYIFRQISKDSKISYLDPDSIDVERFDSNLDLLNLIHSCTEQLFNNELYNND